MGSNGSGHNEIIGADGRPISSKPAGVVVLKVPKEVKGIAPQLIQGIAAATRCSVIILPHEYELMMGKIADDTIKSMHEAIHQICGIKE